MTKKSVIDQALFNMTRMVARDSSRIFELLDRGDEDSLRRASEIGCQSIGRIFENPHIDEIFNDIYQNSEKYFHEAKASLEQRACLSEFLEAEYALLRIVGVSRNATSSIIEECSRLESKALESIPEPNRLKQALELLQSELCEDQEVFEKNVKTRKVRRRVGGWSLIFANGAAGALSTLGAPITFGISLSIGAGAAASAAYGGKLALG